MANKIPVTQYSGQFAQMQTGDTIDPAFYTSGGVTTEAKAASFNAANAFRYIITANTVVATLPAAPTQGHTIEFVAASASITGFSVARNGKPIMSLAEDMTVDLLRFFFALTYHDTTDGWRIT